MTPTDTPDRQYYYRDDNGKEWGPFSPHDVYEMDLPTDRLRRVPRAEHEPCERGTIGCSVSHRGNESCEAW